MDFSPIRPTALKYGLYTGLAVAAYSILLYSTNLINNSFLPMLTYVLSIGGVVLAMREYKGQNQGFMPFNKGFGLGFLTSFVGSIVSIIISTVYTSFINTNAIPSILDYQRMKLEENPQMTEEMIDMAMGMTEKMIHPPLSLLVGLVGGAIGAALIGVILAAIMKKDPVN